MADYLADYYEKLPQKLAVMKKEDDARADKKRIEYIENNGSRRSTFCRRSKTIMMNCMELELQTKVKFSLNIKPLIGATKQCKGAQYKSSNYNLGETEISFVEPPVANSTVINAPFTPSTMDVPNEADGPGPSKGVVSTPQKRHLVLSIKEDDDEELCRVYGEKEEVSFSLGCSYKHPKTERQTCSYWVPQWCANLYFKNECDLNNLPYFCPMQKKAIGIAPKEKKTLAKVCKQLKRNRSE